jgi:hypothetical protein
MWFGNVTVFKQKALCTVIMRISPVLLLLPALVLTGSAAIANDDRPAVPQPAIASPAMPAKLTIESLAGIYQGVVDEKELKNWLSELKKEIASVQKKQSTNVPVNLVALLERDARQVYEQARITINANGTFESRMNYVQLNFSVSANSTVNSAVATENLHGKVRLEGNKLVLTTGSDKPINCANGPTSNPKGCECCMTTLYVSADGKMLLLDNPENFPQILRGYVKQ